MFNPRYLSGLALVGLASVIAASAAFAATPKASPAKASGDVVVLSAGSLKTLITKSVAPAFHKATGYTLVDDSAGSGALATDIKNGVYVGDVFLSASPAVTQTLVGKKNGSWVSWYADFAKSPQVLAYNPSSKFKHDLLTEPWYKVITTSGFLVQRTDPATDPGGVLAVDTLKAAAKKFRSYAGALDKIASSSSKTVNPNEDDEQASIQNNSADAAFMYEADAISQGSPWVSLGGVPTEYGQYTATIVRGAPHKAAAEAFIKFLLGKTGQAELKKDRFGVVSPAQVHGTGVPSALTSLFKK
jgi:molybdate/tungstate transport system substrate-binding protein